MVDEFCWGWARMRGCEGMRSTADSRRGNDEKGNLGKGDRAAR